MAKFKRLLLVFVVLLYGCFVFACKGNVESAGNDYSTKTKTEITSDEETSDKLDEISSTFDETSVEDSEIQEGTTSNKDPECISSEEYIRNDEESTTKQNGTVNTAQETTKKSDNTTKEQTTKKIDNTTVNKETTSKKQQQTSASNSTTKTTTAKPTTTKATTTAKQETTTKKQEQTTTKATQTGGSSGAITIPANEFVPSDAAKAKAKTIVSQIINSSMNEYDRVKVIHDYLVNNVNYDLASIENGTINQGNHPSHTAEGALCGNLAVCDGYAQAFELMCAEAGIYAYMMYGTAGGDSHAWNVVKINGEWYQVDCTWDDPIVNGVVVGDGSNITYMYFLLTDNEMYADHVLDTTWSKNAKKCTSTLFNGLGLRLSLEASMKYPGVVLSDINSFYQKTTEYVSNKTYIFSVALPVTESNKLNGDSLTGAVQQGLNFSASFRVGYSYMQVGDYIVYNVEIEVTPV